MTVEQMKIRTIKPENDAELAEIVRKNLEYYHLDIPGTVYFDTELNHLSKYYNTSDKREYFVAVNYENQVIGGVGIAEFDGIIDCAELQKLYLTDSAKGKGLGYILIDKVIDYAKSIGYKALYLETHHVLETAIHMYRKKEFVQMDNPPESVVHSTMDMFFIKKLTENNLIR